jgi:hypothetical protein
MNSPDFTNRGRNPPIGKNIVKRNGQPTARERAPRITFKAAALVPEPASPWTGA